MKSNLNSALKKKAKEKGMEDFKANPAFPKKKRNLPEGKPGAYMKEMQDMGKE